MLIRSAAALLLAVGLLAASPQPPDRAVPSPESHFGHPIGQDRTSLEWDAVVTYFRALEKSSDRIRIEEIGKTTEGRPMIAAFIADPSTLASLGRYAEIQARLADPRRTSDADAARLIAQGKSVVMVTCSVHSTEVASTHTAIEFAWRMATGNTGKTRAILANTILILVPSLNPDGIDLVTRWYRKTLGTPFEGTSPPELYQKYVGHDNNRDWYIFSQAETRNVVSRLHNVWHPHIVYDVHEQGPNGSRMFVPPWLDPIEPNVDPIIAQLSNMVGMTMASDLTAAGKTGVAVNALYDFWTPARHYQAYHGGARILSESASVRLSTPVTIPPAGISAEALGYNPRQSSWNYLEPWLGGEWHLRDIIDYQLIAMQSCLYTAATRRQDLLEGFLRVGRRACDKTKPFAFVVPAAQFDPGSSRHLLETLSFGAVEVDRSAKAFNANGRRYDAGSYVIRMQQPYSSFAKALLERQQYPDLRQYPNGPPRRPYDVTAHTLPLLMGVEVDTIDQPIEAPLTRVKTFSFQPRKRQSTGVYPASDTDSWREVNRLWAAGAPVYRTRRTGDFLSKADPDAVELKRPRIGLYKSWVPAIDEGWTRWLFDDFGFAYINLRNADLQAGSLSQKFDVIVFPAQPPSILANGYKAGTMPEEFTGGIGAKGLQGLKDFVRQGGRLVFLNNSAGYATEILGVGTADVTRGLPSREFYAPGSLLNVTVDTAHPLAYGLPGKIAIWNERSPAFDISEKARAVARYGDSNLLASGWLLGENYLANRAALLDIPMGQGHVILFGMRPQYRAQSYQSFKLFFNSLVY